MKMWDIERTAAQWIGQHSLLERGDRVVVALSGGADSVCLLRILLRLEGELGVQVSAAHYNHQLRGRESDRDEEFVRSLCRRLNVSLALGRGDVAKEAKEQGRGIEETARDMRYGFLRREAGEAKIATAHNADDNVETILLNLIRGAGIRGLGGIPVERDRIIRPLLSLERSEIEGYLKSINQYYVTDSTNSDVRYRRNALRTQVLPLLREMNPSLARTLTGQAQSLSCDCRYLEAVAQEEFEKLSQFNGELSLDSEGLLALDTALGARVAAIALKHSGAEVSRAGIGRVLEIAGHKSPSAGALVSGGVTVQREYGRLVFAREKGAPATFTACTLPVKGEIIIWEAGVRITCRPCQGEILKSFNTFLFKSDAVCGKITVRPRISGDRIRILGANGSKSLKKIFIEKKIPARMRELVPVFADEKGVIAVAGIGADERVCPQAGDEKLIITLEEIATCTQI